MLWSIAQAEENNRGGIRKAARSTMTNRRPSPTTYASNYIDLRREWAAVMWQETASWPAMVKSREDMSCVSQDSAVMGATFVMIAQANSHRHFVITLLLGLKRLTVAGKPALTIYRRRVHTAAASQADWRLDIGTNIVLKISFLKHFRCNVFKCQSFFFIRI